MSAVLARLESLILSMDRLSDLYERETALIAGGDPDGLRSLADSKSELARTFEENARSVGLDQAALGSLEPEDRERLELAALRFRSASEENATAVRIATLAEEAILSAGIQAINRARELEAGVSLPLISGHSYGQMRPSAPMAFNQVF